MADLPLLPGHLVAITGMYTTKLERFDEIGTHGKWNFESKFLEMVFQSLEEITTCIYEQN